MSHLNCSKGGKVPERKRTGLRESQILPTEQVSIQPSAGRCGVKVKVLYQILILTTDAFSMLSYKLSMAPFRHLSVKIISICVIIQIFPVCPNLVLLKRIGTQPLPLKPSKPKININVEQKCFISFLFTQQFTTSLHCAAACQQFSKSSYLLQWLHSLNGFRFKSLR